MIHVQMKLSIQENMSLPASLWLKVDTMGTSTSLVLSDKLSPAFPIIMTLEPVLQWMSEEISVAHLLSGETRC